MVSILILEKIFNTKPQMVDSKSDAIGWKIFPLQLQKTCQLNLNNGDYSETKLPRGLMRVKWILC